MAKRILAVILFALMIAAAAVRLPAAEPAQNGADEIPPASVSRLYRESDRILLATCTRVTEDEGGNISSRFIAEEALEGEAAENEIIILPVSASQGARYLLYLKSEDGGEAAAAEPFAVEDDSIICENEPCTIESIRADIERQRRILTVPAESLYYGSLEGLAAACDEIIVARVLSVSEPTETVCRAEGKGESTLATLEQVFLRIKIENGLFGSLRYGDKLSVVLSPYSSRPVINASTLTPKTVGAPPASYPKAGSVYIFFLERSEDSKSDYYFTVNPYEGYVMLLGNTITHPYYNEAFREINDLRKFSELLRAAMEPPENNE